MENNTPRKPYNGFIGTPAAKVLGLITAFAVTFLMMYMGAYTQYCLFAFVGALLFIIPKNIIPPTREIKRSTGFVLNIETTKIERKYTISTNGWRDEKLFNLLLSILSLHKFCTNISA